MNLFWAAFLGLIQGITEFLPVSSSGHLVIVQSLIPNFNQPGVFFDVVLHLATLFAVVYFFRKRIFLLGQKYFILLIVGTIPAALIGYLFQSQLENMFGGINTVGIELIITGFLNLLVDKSVATSKTISIKNSFLVGIAQAIAIIPGISRSGATIFAGVKLGISRKEIAEFSFLLSVPAILGANILQFITHGVGGDLPIIYYIVGFLAAFISGFISINFTLKALISKRFKWFAYYAFALGTVAIFL